VTEHQGVIVTPQGIGSFVTAKSRKP
jgi:hypothetical protein